MHAATRILSATLACATAALAHAQGGPDELWNMTTRMEMAGMPPHNMTNQVCMKKGQTQADKFSQDKNCKVAEQRTVGSKTTWKIVCTGRDAITGTGEVTRTRDSMDGRIRMQGNRGSDSYDMTMVMSGKLAGSCTWEEPAKQVAAFKAQGDAAMAAQCREAMDNYSTMLFTMQNAPCAPMRAEYCSRVTKAAQGMRTPAGFRKIAEGKDGLANKGWEEAGEACGVKVASVRADACKGAMSAKDWAFVGNHCPTEAEKIAAEHCAGRDYTVAMKSEYREVCQNYARRSTRAAGTAAKPAAAPEGGQAASNPADAVKEGVKEGTRALRRLFGN